MNKIFKSGKIWTVSVGLIILVAGLWILFQKSQAMSRESNNRIISDTSEQIKNAEELRKYGVNYNTPKCEGDILVEIGNIKVMVPRDSPFKLESGETIKVDLRHPKYNCNLTKLSNIQAVDFLGTLTIQSKEKLRSNWTRYSQYQNQIEQSGKDNKIKIFSNQIKKIDHPAYDLYLLPDDTFPTLNHEPVLYECGKMPKGEEKFVSAFCSTAYIHPSGLAISYRFFRKDYSVEEYSEIDRKKREQIAKMIDSVKSQETLNNRLMSDMHETDKFHK